ncbi:MAG: hypothetical protein P8N76_23095 [Pirellulaceae bacterium]|nr:hypothetical protein [Pirellulaceae bacterium]
MVKIDTDEMTNGEQVATRLRGDRTGGIPWMVILDAGGDELISADGPNGNIGCPVEPAGIEHFMKMLEQTAKHSSDETRSTIRASLEEYAKPYQEKRGL